MHAICRFESCSSKRHSSTPLAFSEKRAKLTPLPSQVAPRGNGCPGQVLIFSSPITKGQPTAECNAHATQLTEDFEVSFCVGRTATSSSMRGLRSVRLVWH